MYSFAQREDVLVVDEPLYGHYLRVSGADHPGREQVLASMNCDGDSVMHDLLDAQARDDSRHHFFKHMAHHLIALDLGFLTRTCNIMLIRDPEEMLPSLTIQVPQAKLADTGLRQQWELYSDLLNSGQDPAIIDSRELLLDPEGVLRKLCAHLGLAFSKSMLHWTAGARAEDGVWAPYWYHALHRSTGFAAYEPKTGFPAALKPLLVECKPWYDRLFAGAIRSSNHGT